MPDQEAREISRCAAKLFTGPLLDDPLVRERARPGDPVPVFEPDHSKICCWFVPLVATEKLVGFFVLTKNGELKRFSRFPAAGADFEGCPESALWTDPDTVLATAAPLIGEGDNPETPYLGYDGSPEHLAWIVVVNRQDGGAQRIVVTGQNAYQSTHTV